MTCYFNTIRLSSTFNSSKNFFNYYNYLLKVFTLKKKHADNRNKHLCLVSNDFTIKNFISFIAMTLIIARKTITAVFGTMALQLIEVFQCSVTYSMKQTSSFFDCCTAFIDFIVCECCFSYINVIEKRIAIGKAINLKNEILCSLNRNSASICFIFLYTYNNLNKNVCVKCPKIYDFL